MAKYDNPTTPGRPEQMKPLDPDGQTLVAALTAAILAARGGARPPHPDASAAEDGYAVIKAVLRTHSEKPSDQTVQQS